MKKYFIIFFYIVLAVFICPEDVFGEKSNDKAMYLIISFDSSLKINGKNIIYDISSDSIKYLKKYDSTTDMIKSGKFIYQKDELEKYDSYKNNFSMDLKKYFEKSLDQTVNIISIEDLSKIEEGLLIDLKILDYTEGEYNLIKNRNSIVKLLVKLHEKSLKEKVFLIKVAVISCKSDIEYPIEKMRLENIADKLSKNILIFLKNYNINNKLK
jgi:hypothetical protein